MLGDGDEDVRGHAAEPPIFDGPDVTDVYIASATSSASRSVFYGDVLKQALIHRSAAERLAHDGTSTHQERAARDISMPPKAMRRLLDELDVPELDALPSR